jgi:MarR family transcriptional regulator, organic hydroperoxide resistance regulator
MTQHISPQQIILGRVDDVELLGLLIKGMTREADRRINDLLRPLGITSCQAEALQLLDRYGPLSLGELGALMIAEGGHPSRLVDRLVEAGLAHRRQAAHDRRQIEISCTDRGSELATRAAESKEIFRSWVRERLRGQDVAAASAVLRACLVDTPLGETVERRLDRPLAARLELEPTPPR